MAYLAVDAVLVPPDLMTAEADARALAAHNLVVPDYAVVGAAVDPCKYKEEVE